jgi:hypothetical protein
MLEFSYICGVIYPNSFSCLVDEHNYLKRHCTMTFKTRTEELRKAVEVLRPFVKEKVEDEDPYRISYRDKLYFEVFTDCAYLFVLIPGVRICERIWAESSESNVSFCFRMKEFCDFLENRHDDILTFEEDRFLGFFIFEKSSEPDYTPMQAFSTTQILKKSPVDSLTTYPQSISIEKDFLISHLDRLSKLGDYDSSIFFNIEQHCCTTWIQSSKATMVTCDTVNVHGAIDFGFFIPNRFILKGGISLLQRDDSSYSKIYYNENGIKIGDSDHFIVLYQHKIKPELITDVKKLFASIDTKDKIVVNTDSILSFLKRARNLCQTEVPTVFHISRGYMTMHRYDPYYEVAIHEYFSVLDGFNDTYITIDTKSMLAMLEDIDAPYIQILRLPNGLLYLSKIDEDPFGNTLRILNPGEVKPDDLPYYQKESQALVKRFNPLS